MGLGWVGWDGNICMRLCYEHRSAVLITMAFTPCWLVIWLVTSNQGYASQRPLTALPSLYLDAQYKYKTSHRQIESIRRQDPNNYSDTETRCLVSPPPCPSFGKICCKFSKIHEKILILNLDIVRGKTDPDIVCINWSLNNSKFSYQMASIAFEANLITRWHFKVSSKCPIGIIN